MTILAISDQQVTLMLPTEFQVNWLFGSGEEAERKKISEMAATAAILDFRTILAVFDLQVTPMLPTELQVNSSL